jgi:nicotinamide-nucleotide amidase
MNAPSYSSSSATLTSVVEHLAQVLKQRGWRMATAESCTGGGIAAACTDVAGSSEWFERGFVTYSNAAKTELLAVDAVLIEQHGAVSEPVVRAMAEGAVAHAHAHAQVSVAVTGIAGPGGGSADKPVGTVWLAWHVAGATKAHRIHFNGDRAAVRAATVRLALTGLLALCGAAAPPTNR